MGRPKGSKDKAPRKGEKLTNKQKRERAKRKAERAELDAIKEKVSSKKPTKPVANTTLGERAKEMFKHPETGEPITGAEKRKLNLRPKWKKGGESPNPGGVPKTPEAIENKELRKRFKTLTNKDFKELTNLLIDGDVDELKVIANERLNGVKSSGKYSALQVMTATVALNIMSKGSAHDWDIFLSRLIGRVKETVKIEDPNHSQLRGVVHVVIPSNGREAKPA